MPGEDRKFKRRRIVAFIPVCNCEREAAVSHALVTGIHARGVAVGSITEVSVGEGRGVAVGSDVLVAVGEGIVEEVAVSRIEVDEVGAVVGWAEARGVPVGGRELDTGAGA